MPVTCIFTGIAHSATGNPWVNARHLAGGCPDQRLLNVSDLTNNGISNYNGITASLSQRVKWGLQFRLNYTLQPHERRRVERRRAAIQRPKQLTRRVLEPCVRREPGNRSFSCAAEVQSSRARSGTSPRPK